MNNFGQQLLEIESEMCKQLSKVNFIDSSIAYVYNPLEYAFETHSDYINKYCLNRVKVLFLGMNSGPFGMAQNGVPFGEVGVVRDWLEIRGNIGRPSKEHPLRRITGLRCNRSEVSGQRFWALIRQICETPQRFFSNCFVHNYCPLSFMLSSGKNITPPQLKASDRKQLFTICDEALRNTVELLRPQVILCVGKFAEERALISLNNVNIDVRVHCILHPSPINPSANKGWHQKVMSQLIQFHVIQYLKPNVTKTSQTSHLPVT